MDVRFLRIALDERLNALRGGSVVAFPPVSTRPNWNEAVDRLTYSARDIEGDLQDFESEIFHTEDIGELERIATMVQAIETYAAILTTTARDRADRLRLKEGA